MPQGRLRRRYAGPDLTRIGGIRTERDLLESIVFPSASFVRSYEPVRVVTTDERTFNGVLKKDAPDEIIVIIAADKEERVARADIESITPSRVAHARGIGSATHTAGLGGSGRVPESV